MAYSAKTLGSLKFARCLGVIGLALCAASGVALAKPNGGKPAGGQPSGGHPAAVHFNAARATPHFNGTRAAPHFASRPHFAPHISGSHTGTVFSRRHTLSSHSLTTTAHPLTTTAHPLTTTARPLTTTNHVTAFAHHHAVGGADPAAFMAHRHFAGSPAFRPFFGHGWHPYHHLGWIGPLFWPYAYGDFFYCSLWPGDYCNFDPFWAYGYGDIYESIFSPYDYGEYVQGPGAPERMTSLTQGMAQSCTDEAAEVTGWPINQIQDAVQPNAQQSALLDGVGNAIVKASDEIKSRCPTTVAFTPTDRLAQMQQRLQALVDAVNLISPPLTKFYDSLSDEQKARFNDISPPTPPNPQAGQGQPPAQEAAPSVQAQCNANVMAWPIDQIDSAVHPSDMQRAKLNALQTALSQAADAIKAACPTQVPATPPSRLDAIGNRLQVMLKAVATVQPALADFYNSLSDDQKALFNAMGKQLFAQNQE
jgi:LTXXQ motif family protein